MNENTITFRKQAQVLDCSELERHASVGRICGCSQCFCCIALREQGQRRVSGNLFLIEFYTTNPETGESGWDINFAWVFAFCAAGAKRKLSEAQGKRFGEVITCERQSRITPLAGEFRVNTPDANLFIYR